MCLSQLSIKQLSTLYKKKKLSPREYAKDVLSRIESHKHLNAFVTVDSELMMNQAGISEERWLKGEARSLLEGIPIGIKDIIETKNLVTTYGCKAYDQYLPSTDAFAVGKLKSSGAVIAVKCNTSQFAMGPTGEVSYNGPVVNPRKDGYVSGGSSSGSAAAVAAGILPGALGTDSGGSIRLPSALCGVVGIKPTLALVSNQGVMPVGESVDCIGPITRSVEDGAIILSAIAGYNEMDWRSAPSTELDYAALIQAESCGMQGVVLENFMEGAVVPEVIEVCNKALEKLVGIGFQLTSKRLPDLSEFRVAHQLNMMASAHYVHKRDIENHRNHMYEEVYQRLIQGDIRSDECFSYEMMKHDFRRLLMKFMGNASYMIYPTTPMLPCKIGEGGKKQVVNGYTTSSFESNGAHTWLASYAGLPSITLPVGLSKEGFPIGISITGKPFGEIELLRVAHQIERQLGIY